MDRVLVQGGVAAAIKVSLPGYNVNTADIDQLAFDGRYSGFTSFLESSVVLTANDSTYTITYPFALTVPPLMLMQIEDSPDRMIAPFTDRGQGIDEWMSCQTGLSSASIRLNYYSQVFTVNYKIFRRLLG